MLASRGVLNAVRFGLILSLVAVTGCVTSPGGKSRPANQSGIILEGTQAQSGPPGSTIIRTAEDPLLDGVVRIDLLLPLGANAAGVQRVANSLLNAAQLAEGDLRDNRIILSVRDTYGTPEGAAQAAQDAIDQGTELILGPLFSHSVAEVGPIAGIYGVNVIAFSTDSAVAGDNVFLLSFLPEQEIDRVVEYASLQGISSYGALTPETEYGARVDAAFADAVQRNGGVVTVATVYPRDPQGVLAPVREFTEYGRRAGALKGAIRRAKAAGNTSRVRRLKLRDTLGDVSYQAAIVPEDAQLMRSIAPLFPYFDAHPTKVKLLGTGKWNDPMVFEEPWLKGAWFAAPSPQESSIFVNAYQNAYGAAPSNPWLASLGYDAVALAGALIQTGLPDPFGYETLTDPEGFSGVNGIFRFGAEGLSERGLSVMEIGEGVFVEISAAPGSFGGY